ncbi:MAG: FAD-dependent oxidoreductase [Proteobacteria bacterium]|nr:FAD-dependent oxidoreductase [Pseudomonadota bacterium]
MGDRVVIIGAGQAAAQLALSLRQGKFSGSICVFGDEPHQPYQRPPLSKKFLSESAAPESLFLRPANYWREQGVDIGVGIRVERVDRSRQRVVLADGGEAEFDHLILATGTRARELRVPGMALKGVFSLRRIDDVLRLRVALDDARRIVIVGGGYIGLEVAAVMRAAARDVVILEAEDRVLKRVTSPVVADYFDALHRRRGVDVRTGTGLAAIEGEARVTAVRLADGARLPADLVLVAVGARANDELATAAGLECADGIVVDAFAKTIDPTIFAVGDCTRLPSRRYGRRVRLECVQNAIDHAKAVAASILGHPESYDPVPWFWSDQYDVKLQMAGLGEGYAEALVVGDAPAGKFSVEYRSGDRLIAVDAINDGRAYMSGRRRIAQETEAIVSPGNA